METVLFTRRHTRLANEEVLDFIDSAKGRESKPSAIYSLQEVYTVICPCLRQLLQLLQCETSQVTKRIAMLLSRETKHMSWRHPDWEAKESNKLLAYSLFSQYENSKNRQRISSLQEFYRLLGDNKCINNNRDDNILSWDYTPTHILNIFFQIIWASSSYSSTQEKPREYRSCMINNSKMSMFQVWWNSSGNCIPWEKRSGSIMLIPRLASSLQSYQINWNFGGTSTWRKRNWISLSIHTTR